MHSVQLRHDMMQALRREDDGQTFLMAWTGGVKAAQLDQDRWRLLPVLHDRRPHVNGFYTQSELARFLGERGLRFVAFQQINWISGSYLSHWAPRIPGEQNYSLSPSDLWSNVARHLQDARMRPRRGEIQGLTAEEFEEIIDDASEAERLAQLISLSLRNLDTSVEHVASFYHDELINQMADGNIEGRRSSSMRDQYLYEHVHSFFLHLGAVRDYLAAFIADQIGKDSHAVDSMARLIDVIRARDIESSALLKIVQSSAYITPKDPPSTKWKASGWLDTATDLRNEFVHRRTYGQRSAERMGSLRAADREAGVFRYFRPIALETSDRDVFDVIVEHYEKVSELLYRCAKASGHNSSIPQLDPNDVISVQVTRTGS
ncbi:hypothetical protein [Rhizobium leguminosarum]|uniref:hypothetical protein n=1 Tax=Rhizobium leguminosarum TaxID=384 RepID=UPI003CFCB850